VKDKKKANEKSIGKSRYGEKKRVGRIISSINNSSKS
jgi:hypothetical protein